MYIERFFMYKNMIGLYKCAHKHSDLFIPIHPQNNLRQKCCINKITKYREYATAAICHLPQHLQTPFIYTTKYT